MNELNSKMEMMEERLNLNTDQQKWSSLKNKKEWENRASWTYGKTAKGLTKFHVFWVTERQERCRGKKYIWRNNGWHFQNLAKDIDLYSRSLVNSQKKKSQRNPDWHIVKLLKTKQKILKAARE